MSTIKQDDIETRTPQDQQYKEPHSPPQQDCQKLSVQSQDLLKRVINLLKNNIFKIITLLILIWVIVLQIQIVNTQNIIDSKDKITQQNINSVKQDLDNSMTKLYGPFMIGYWATQFKEYQAREIIKTQAQIYLEKKSLVTLKANGKIFLKNSSIFYITFVRDQQQFGRLINNIPQNSYFQSELNKYVSFKLDQEVVLESASYIFQIACYAFIHDQAYVEFNDVEFIITVQGFQE